MGSSPTGVATLSLCSFYSLLSRVKGIFRYLPISPIWRFRQFCHFVISLIRSFGDFAVLRIDPFGGFGGSTLGAGSWTRPFVFSVFRVTVRLVTIKLFFVFDVLIAFAL